MTYPAVLKFFTDKVYLVRISTQKPFISDNLRNLWYERGGMPPFTALVTPMIFWVIEIFVRVK